MQGSLYSLQSSCAATGSEAGAACHVLTSTSLHSPLLLQNIPRHLHVQLVAASCTSMSLPRGKGAVQAGQGLQSAQVLLSQPASSA